MQTLAALHRHAGINCLLVFCVIYHGLYGLRTIALDLGMKRERLLFWICTIAGSVLFAGFLVETPAPPGKMIQHDVLIVGGGLAGFRRRSGSASVGTWRSVEGPSHPFAYSRRPGGINAAWETRSTGRDDSPQRHAFDTIKGGDYLADQGGVGQDARPWPRKRSASWNIAARRSAGFRTARCPAPFGGAGFPRAAMRPTRPATCCCTRCTSRPLDGASRLTNERGHAAGRARRPLSRPDLAYDLRGRFQSFASKFCVLATGATAGSTETRPMGVINTGSGIGMALLAGAVKDLEFVQFHPTTLFGTNIRSPNAPRRGRLAVEPRGGAVHARYAPTAMELAPRHRGPVHSNRNPPGAGIRGRLTST